MNGVANDDDLSSVSGLPPELGIDDDLKRTQQRLRIDTDRRRYGKAVTIVRGFDRDANLKEIASTLKSRLACGGTAEPDEIVLQGNHVERATAVLRDLGYTLEE
jgi:translation initiation factor 1